MRMRAMVYSMEISLRNDGPMLHLAGRAICAFPNTCRPSSPAPRDGRRDTLRPGRDLHFGLLLRDRVHLPDRADQPLAASVDLVELGLGELAPLLADGRPEGLPVARDVFPFHDSSLMWRHEG